MKHLFLSTALLLCFAQTASALDNSASVKVTPLLKTTTS